MLLALPKTGTSALEAALRARADAVLDFPPELKHVPAFRYNRFLKPLFGVIEADRKLETMALVREPVSWLSSWYRYRGRRDLDGHPNSTRDLTFDAFVEGYLSNPRPPFAQVGSPRKFVSNGQGKVAVRHLFQYEQIDKAAAFLEARLDVSMTLERKNVSPARPLALSAALETRLRAECPEEFSLWERAARCGSAALPKAMKPGDCRGEHASLFEQREVPGEVAGCMHMVVSRQIRPTILPMPMPMPMPMLSAPAARSLAPKWIPGRVAIPQ